MGYKKIKIKEGINLHIINTNKFKNNPYFFHIKNAEKNTVRKRAGCHSLL